MEDDPPPDAPIPTAVCELCHREVPSKQIVVLSGRRLCFGCAGAWFDEDEE